MNFGVIGSGFIVDVFVKTAKQFRGYHLTGIWGRHMEKLEKFAEDFDYLTTDLDELLSDPKIDVVYVALPNGLHYEYAMKALKANKHVLLEKPFTSKYEDAKKLIAYANKKHLLCIEAVTLRYNPMYSKIKQQIKSLGDIKMIEANFSQYSRRYDRFKKGEILPVFDYKMAGGALLDLNVYNIHFVAGIFGKPKSVHYFPNMERKVDTSGVLVLDYGKFKASLVAGKDTKSEAHVTIQGDEGYLHVPSTASRCAGYKLVLYNGKVKNVEGENAEFSGFKHEFKAFEKLYKSKDEKLIKEYNENTLLVMQILDDALSSAQIIY